MGLVDDIEGTRARRRRFGERSNCLMSLAAAAGAGGEAFQIAKNTLYRKMSAGGGGGGAGAVSYLVFGVSLYPLASVFTPFASLSLQPCTQRLRQTPAQGKTGWIGQKVLAMLLAKGIKAQAADSRLENVEQVAAEIDAFKPTHVLNCAGLTGRPNVDWCEDH